MKKYHILDLISDSRKVVIATSYLSPLSEILSISSELKGMKYRGEILFDLLLCNGFSSNRILKMNFNGETINLSDISVVSNLEKNVLDELYLFFYKHPHFVKSSSLPDPQKYILLNNLLYKEDASTTYC